MSHLNSLLTHAQNPDPSVRLSAIKALGRLDDPRAAKALLQISRRDPAPFVKQAAALALKQHRSSRRAQGKKSPRQKSRRLSSQEKMLVAVLVVLLVVLVGGGMLYGLLGSTPGALAAFGL